VRSRRAAGGGRVKALWIVVDSLRADARHPALDALARGGCAFPRSHCSGSWTIPSLVAMDSGRLPHRVGVCNWRHAPRPGAPSLLRAFAAAGIPVRLFAPSPRWIFRAWGDDLERGDSQDPEAVLAALREPGDALVLIHHWWTHFPYAATRANLAARRRMTDEALDVLARRPETAPRFEALYRRAVAHFCERLLPRYLDAAGPDATVLLTGDHGENWGEALPPGRGVEHIFDLHGRWMTDDTCAVPLILAGAAGLPWPASDDADDGRSLLDGATAPRAVTVASQNTWTPEVYPREGRRMWRGFSARSASGRRGWAAPAEGGGDLRALWSASVGPGPGSLPDPQAPLDRRLRVLGYLD